MTSKNRYIKGLEKTIIRIEEHIVKLDEARRVGNENLVIYYQKEIYYKFWRNIEKDIEKIGLISAEMNIKLSHLTKKLYETKSIPMNTTLSSNSTSRGK